MPSPVFSIAPVTYSIRYTGSNSADINIQVPNISIVSEVNGVLTLDVNGNHLPVPTGDWILFNGNGVSALPDFLYVKEWVCNATCSEIAGLPALVDDVSDLGSDVSALAGVFVRAVGVAPVPSLLASATANVNVQLQPAMPDASYAAYATLFAGIGIGALQVNSITVVDVDTVTVVVENTGLLTLAGANVMVHAID